MMTKADIAGPCGRSDWLLGFWRRETLFSVGARRHWVAPDVLEPDWIGFVDTGSGAMLPFPGCTRP
jgi:hypothetical protein